MSRIKKGLTVVLSALLYSSVASACDICALYNSVQSFRPEAGTFRTGISEQFSYFGKVQQQGKYVDNLEHQHLASSTTQIIASYDFTHKFSLQANLPYINRRYKRISGEGTESGTEAGVGDLTILGKFVPYQHKTQDSMISVQIFGGVKLPTGDSDRLKEELGEHHHEEEGEEELHFSHAYFKHGGHHHNDERPSAIHGHDLALGSGSYDIPVGINVFSQFGRALLLGSIQYSFRTEGDYSYEYADDLTYTVLPAYYVALHDEYTVAAGAALSGEYKGKDRGKDGMIQDDTGIRSLFLGPAVVVTASQHLSGEFAVDLPLEVNNTAFQVVPSYRIRAGLTYRF